MPTPDQNARLQPGDQAPQFSLPDATGATVSLADQAGHRTIVYFYPAAETPGCTTEACDFRDSWQALERDGYTVIGISKDPVTKLASFAQHHELPFTLLSDPELAVHRAYGAYGVKKLYGKEHLGVLRSTFVIDERGVVLLARYNVRAKGHVASLSKQLASL